MTRTLACLGLLFLAAGCGVPAPSSRTHETTAALGPPGPDGWAKGWMKVPTEYVQAPLDLDPNLRRFYTIADGFLQPGPAWAALMGEFHASARAAESHLSTIDRI